MRAKKFRDMVFITTLLYLPAAHLAQTVEDDDAEYRPASQLVQTVKAAAPEYVPAGQLVHTVEPVAAGSQINTPARAETCPTHPQTTILMYRATTGSMNISSLFCLLL
jgi:hypothetical protein